MQRACVNINVRCSHTMFFFKALLGILESVLRDFFFGPCALKVVVNIVEFALVGSEDVFSR